MRHPRPPNSSYNNHRQHNFPVMTYKPYLLKEDDERKIPAFLVKLWNIVEGQAYKDIVCWDESGLSFHIMDPYAFCSNVLPQYFKHKNLNSLVRQLNMYGFRKNTPIDRSGLARAESDQDHLEFAHPYFRRDHPHLLMNIKRKAPGGKNSPTSNQHKYNNNSIPMEVADGGAGQNSFDMNEILEELGTLRERQHHMEIRIEELTKENEMLWNEMAHVRGTHLKQQQLVNKLIQFLVALVGPNGKQSNRLGKRLISERSVNHTGESSNNAIGQLQSILPVNASEILDRLINEITSGDGTGFSSSAGNLIFGRSPHKQGMKHQYDQFNHHIPTEFDAIDNLLMDNNVRNNQQIQPYTGKGMKTVGDERESLRSDRSVSGCSDGPIIAEVIEDLDGVNSVADTSANNGYIYHPQQQIINNEAKSPHIASPIIEQRHFGNNQQIRQQQKFLPSQNNCFQPSNTTTNGYVQEQKRHIFPGHEPQQILYNQQNQTMPVYQPQISFTTINPDQQQQTNTFRPPPSNSVRPQKLQQNQEEQRFIQQQEVSRQCPTAPPQGLYMRTSSSVAPNEQQQVSQFIQQQPFEAINYNTNSHGSSLHTPTASVPTFTTDGMMLNDEEIASIAGLNAYLDNDDATAGRFNFSDSMGEHWNNVDEEEFRELLNYGNSTENVTDLNKMDV
uniref:HSF-type DNA-binding domain-containing protein n=2 Tax=Meloidogyne incognita group TaxID=654580 RepID=A0A914M6X1_MELIC